MASDPRQVISEMHANDQAAISAGITIDHITDGVAGVRMTVREDMLNGHGTCHGGYLFLLADVAFAYACNTSGVLNVAAAADILYVAPAAAGATLRAEAVRRMRFGKDGRQGLYDVTVTDDATAQIVAVFTGRAHQVGKP